MVNQGMFHPHYIKVVNFVITAQFDSQQHRQILAQADSDTVSNENRKCDTLRLLSAFQENGG